MGNITTTAAANAHFFKHRFSPFKDGNPALWHRFGAGNGRKKTSCASANNGDIHRSRIFVYI
jgi:hypothetical protein